MKTINRIVLLSLASLMTFSCGKDDGPVTPPPAKNKAPEIKAQSFNASEAASDSDVIGKVNATDPEKDKLTFVLTTNSDDLFEISETGDISLAASKSLDYETKTSHELTVEVTDGKAKAAAKMTIAVVDVDENQAPTITAQSFSVAENSTASTVIGTVIATDPDGDNLTYTLADVTGALATFEIISDEIKLKSGFLDYEVLTSHTIAATVSDGTLSATANITVNVTDVNESPFFADRNYTFSKAEDIDDTVIIATVTGTDPDGDTLIYTLNNNPGSLFEINSAGEISLATGKSLDFETLTSHTVTVQATDGNLTALQHGVKINVTDVNEDEYTVGPWMGNGNPGPINAAGQSARFDQPKGMVVVGNNIYIADSDNHVIRHIDITTGIATTFAGTGVAGYNDGTKQTAQFRNPSSIAVDRFGVLYVADTGNHSIRKITGTAVTTIGGNGMNPGFTDGPLLNSRFRFPTGIAVDDSGFNVYVADHANHAIRRISIAQNGNINVTTIAGIGGISGDVDGQFGTSLLNFPVTIALYESQNLLYITDSGNNKIKTMSKGGGAITSVTSSGTGFARPYGITIDQNNGTFYATNLDNHKVYKSVKDNNGNYTTTVIAGSSTGFVNGPGSLAKFRQPWGIGLNTQGTIFVSEFGNHTIRKITEIQQP